MNNEYVAQALSLFQQGFDTVNSIQGLIIAALAAYLMKRYNQILVWTLVATIAHEAVNVGRRIMGDAPNPLPNLADVDGDLKLIGIRFLGYLIAITILYIVKRIVLRG